MTLRLLEEALRTRGIDIAKYEHDREGNEGDD